MGKDKTIDAYEMKLQNLKDKFHNMLDCGASKDYAEIDAKELGEVADMLKDVYEACYYLKAANYYEKITDAMEENSEEENEMYMQKYLPEYEGKYYSGGMRSGRTGRVGRSTNRGNRSNRTGMMYYSPIYDPMYHEDDIDWDDNDIKKKKSWEEGRMYYTEPRIRYPMNNDMNREYEHDWREGKSPLTRKTYMEMKDDPNVDKNAKSKELEKYLQDIQDDMNNLINGMDVNEKAMLKQKLTTIAQKV